MSALAAACIALVQRKALQSPPWACLLGGLAFASVPLVYVQSTTAMDYVWALACLTASTYALVSGRAVLAGVLLGLAIGCRLTSVLLCLPLAYLAVVAAARGRGARTLAALLVPAGTIALLAYAPVLAQEKWSFDVADFLGTQIGRVTGSPAVPAQAVLRRATVELWGDLGCAALACGALASAVPTLRLAAGLRAALRTPLVVAALSAIALVAALFLRMPIEAGYLIPLVPFVLWLFAALLRPRVFACMCLALLLAPWLDWSARGIRPGPILRGQSARRSEMDILERSLIELRSLQKPAIVVAGRWYMMLEQQHRGSVVGSAELVMSVRTRAQLESYLRSGCELYYLPGAELHNRVNRGFDLDALGFTPLGTDPADSSGK
jgi:hypothetical protein